ncbi:branched-chain amino acid ABC transporter permease [Oceanithermus desulfurans]|uniref:Branched-chain amino acid ABC transporter permease n=2 Tax=Oceanithermus desulfurans TaxID=227924 RepID=A0A511RLB8_9DEIN|nr:branched-chain amino acid ABC transporter permease [Oceanithermus desulfurans]MBB6029070.1 branched-chain amino acid transport system permease protein [Oceanithermus desulfurans]GEM90461.1 branched-chain amino acid ABC transporter permease [Oceanithermus desulfurans NBRC 100063]
MRNPWTRTGNYKTSYAQDTTIFATYSEQASLVVFLIGMLVLPRFLSRGDMQILDLILIYALAVLGLNIITGYAGLINIGHAAFLGVGAYTAALVAPYLPFWLVLPVAGLVAAVAGAVVGIPALRIKHLYLAIATLAFQLIFEWAVGHSPALEQGGAMAMPRVVFLGYKVGFKNHHYFWYYVTFVVLVIMAFGFRNLLRTRFGRSLVAVRDNDRAADAMGMDPGRTKVFAFALGAFYAGVAGALYAYWSRAVVIEDYSLMISIKFLAMAIVGGLGTLVGSFFGPAFLELLDINMETFSYWIKEIYNPPGVDVGSAIRPLAFGLAIVLFLIFEPRGLANWWRLLRSYFRNWPFKY